MSLVEMVCEFSNTGERTYLNNLITKVRINVFLLLIILADFVTFVCFLLIVNYL